MRILRITLISLLALYIGLVVLFESWLGYSQPTNTNSLVIDDITVHAYTPNSIMENPIYAGSNQVVSGYGSFNGYLEDNDYVPISWDLNQNNYTVPEDKKLIIGVSQQIDGNTNNILIDDQRMLRTLHLIFEFCLMMLENIFDPQLS